MTTASLMGELEAADPRGALAPRCALKPPGVRWLPGCALNLPVCAAPGVLNRACGLSRLLAKLDLLVKLASPCRLVPSRAETARMLTLGPRWL